MNQPSVISFWMKKTLSHADRAPGEKVVVRKIPVMSKMKKLKMRSEPQSDLHFASREIGRAKNAEQSEEQPVLLSIHFRSAFMIDSCVLRIQN